MADRAVKGVVLAAGLGTRLRPLTERWPKPLMPFAGTTPLALALYRLHQAGIESVAINSHWLPEQVAQAARANPFRQNLHLSFEPEILGTGGVYNPLRAWQGDADLVVLNGDVVSTVDVAALLARHRESGAVATMALLPEVIPGESGVWHAGGQVRGIGRDPVEGCQAGNYACVQVLSSELLDLLPKEGAFDVITKGYQVALARGMKVAGFVHDGYWHDLRTPQFYAAAVLDWLKRQYLANDPVGVLASAAVKYDVPGQTIASIASRIAADAQVGPLVAVEAGATVGSKAVVRRSLVLPGAEIAAGAVVEDRIVGVGFDLPAR